MEPASESLIAARHAKGLRDLWQGRALTAARGKTGAVLLSVLAHNYDDALQTLLQVVFPGFKSITAPFLCSAGRIAKSGAIIADVIDRYGKLNRNSVIYEDEIALRDDFRRLADALKFTDAERVEMFAAVQQWVVADTRLDPTMDPKDPDAKRLVH